MVEECESCVKGERHAGQIVFTERLKLPATP